MLGPFESAPPVEWMGIAERGIEGERTLRICGKLQLEFIRKCLLLRLKRSENGVYTVLDLRRRLLEEELADCEESLGMSDANRRLRCFLGPWYRDRRSCNGVGVLEYVGLDIF